MRILMGVEHMAPTDGVAVQSLEVGRELASRGHEILVVFQNDGVARPAWQLFATEIRATGSLDFLVRKPARTARSFPSAVMTGRGLRPDVIYDNLAWTLPWSLAVGKLSNTPVLAHVHGFGPEGEMPPRVGRLLRRSPRVVAVSDFVRARLVGDLRIPEERLVTVHNGIDPDHYRLGRTEEKRAARHKLGVSQGAFVVGHYGRLHPTKGTHVLLAALQRLQCPSDRPLEVIVLGDPVDARYGAALRSAAAGLRCHWIPARPDVLGALHAADVMVMPSLCEEAFGRAVIEPLSTGRPVLASRTGGIPEVLTGTFQKWLVPPGDAAALCGAIEQLIGWQDTDPGLAERCRAHVVHNFSLSHFIDAIEQELLSLAQS